MANTLLQVNPGDHLAAGVLSLEAGIGCMAGSPSLGMLPVLILQGPRDPQTGWATILTCLALQASRSFQVAVCQWKQWRPA
jgi:hypothetical protein